MHNYIKKIQSKTEETRKQILAGVMIVSMSLVGFIWVHSLGTRFGSPKIQEQANDNVKPFKLFGNSISETFSSISASVGNATSKIDIKKEVVVPKSEKIINLIPVESTN